MFCKFDDILKKDDNQNNYNIKILYYNMSNNKITIIYNILLIFIIIFIYFIKSKIMIIIDNNNIIKKLNTTIDKNININTKYIINRDNDNEFNTIIKNIKIKKFYQNIVIITSKIIITNSNYKNLYTHNDRYNQTIETINSIKKYIPDVCIFLLDNSDFSDIDMINELYNKCDVFINPKLNKKLEYYTNNYPHKGISEAYQIIYLLDIINNIDIKYNNLFKISGRYIINDTFNINIFNNENINFKKISTDYSLFDSNYYSSLFKISYRYYTSFYKISYNNILLYINSYKIIIKNIKNKIINTDIEILLPYLIKIENIQLLEHIGITQNIASGNVSNKYI
jgi:hypothetical protein